MTVPADDHVPKVTVDDHVFCTLPKSLMDQYVNCARSITRTMTARDCTAVHFLASLLQAASTTQPEVV